MAAVWKTDSAFYHKYLLNFMIFYQSRADYKMFLEIFLSLVTVAAFGIFAIKPTTVTIASLITEINSKEEIVSQLDQKIINLAAAQNIVTQYSQILPLIETSVPSQGKIDSYISQLQKIADRNTISITNFTADNVLLVGNVLVEDYAPISPGEIPPEPLPLDASGININLIASGEYLNLLNFLGDLENTRRPLKIDKMIFSVIQEATKESISLSISGRLIFLKL